MGQRCCGSSWQTGVPAACGDERDPFLTLSEARVGQVSVDIFSNLNDEQARAVQQVRGPVCILAGAGSGKTTTITRRVANQVASGSFQPHQIMAVTFTDKAAGEMRNRLTALGVQGAKASTFHSAALAQLRNLSPDPPAQILPSKGLALRQIANSLPKPYRFRPAADLATEVEWARNRRITPDAYEGSLGDHEPPIPADLMGRVFTRYERGKKERGLIDFEDLLELAIQMYETDEDACDRLRSRYSAFTVDEYQDVNLLQETLLRLWLGGRDDLCVVGDDYQSIYGFTGASAGYLLDMPRRYQRTLVAKLEANYRSVPQILEVANKLVPRLGGAEKVLRAQVERSQEPTFKVFTSEAAEMRFIVSQVKRLHHEGVPYEEMAILHRTNFRLDDHEEALAAAGVPFQLANAAFLARQTFRQIRSAFGQSRSTDVAAAALKHARRAGYTDTPPDGVGDQELTRQADLARVVHLAEEFDDGVRTGADFVVDVEGRFSGHGDGRGVNLLTFHRAKGLEFQAVFLPKLQEGEMPSKRSKTEAAAAEERRLLYVGITRAKTHLTITWVSDAKLKPSPFLTELGIGRRAAAARARPEPGEAIGPVEQLKAWRLHRARQDEVPPYLVLHDSTLKEVAASDPSSIEELASISGIGPAKIDSYGEEMLEVLAKARS